MPAHTNALAHESSPYLLQHAHNPVDWLPWGREAFDRARRENKPIFLSIGYSTCYWCHVMERQCFENEEIADLMNKSFICIKVDREERPEVDDIYMMAVQMMTQRGGWPMSLFLTPPGTSGEGDPGLKPFWAGTYIPPEPRYGMMGFPQLLGAIHDAWTSQHDQVTQQADRVADAVHEQLAGRDLSGPIGLATVKQSVSQLMRRHDAELGGFGPAPKFPQASFLNLLNAWIGHLDDPPARDALLLTLDRMARGGLFDQVAGGFHRYSTDEKWLVPHFEKMLYDNGQLVEAYTRTLRIPNNPHADEFKRIIRATCDYALREMTDETGAFWSAQDAEVDAREGGNYVWTPDEVRKAIPDAKLAQLALELYGLDQGPNFRDPHHEDAQPVNVLFMPEPPEVFAAKHGMTLDQLADVQKQVNGLLYAVRAKRKQPMTDDKVLVSWNGLMIAGLALAGHELHEPRYLDAGRRAAEAIVEHMTTPDGWLYRTMRHGSAKTDAVLEDYAFFIHGLIALHRALPGDTRCLDHAKTLVTAVLERFAIVGGGYYDTLDGRGDLFVRTRSVYDGAVPTGASVMVHNMIDLYEITHERIWLDRAGADLRSVGGALRERGAEMACWQTAVLRLLEIEPSLGEEIDPAADQRVSPVTLSFAPGTVQLESGKTLDIELRIARGYHITAEGDGDKGLAGLTFDLRNIPGVSVEVSYPDPVEKKYPFADAPLKVYEGVVKVRLTLKGSVKAGVETGLSKAELVMRYQVCTESSCLEAREYVVPVVWQQ